MDGLPVLCLEILVGMVHFFKLHMCPIVVLRGGSLSRLGNVRGNRISVQLETNRDHLEIWIPGPRPGITLLYTVCPSSEVPQEHATTT